MSTCNHSGPKGQCKQQTLPDSNFCRKHGDERERIRGYRISDPELKERFIHFSQDEFLQSVRQEVILVRSLIEERHSFAKTQAEKIQIFPQIIDATTKLEKLVSTLAKLERQTSQVLEKPAIQKLGRKIVDILTRNLAQVPDRESIIDSIAKEIAAAIIEAHNEEVDG